MITLPLIALYLAYAAHREYQRYKLVQLSKRRFALANEIARLINKDIK